MPARVANSKRNRTSGDNAAKSQPISGWDSILNTATEGLSVHSRTSQIVWANATLCALYCKSPSELIGLTCQEAFHDGAICPHEEVVESGRRIEFDAQLSGRPISIRIEPLSEDQDDGLGFVRMVRIGVDASIEERIRQTERLASLGQLLFGMAHSIGTPLNIISGYTEFLLMRISQDDIGRKELSAILDQTRRIATLFSEALDMARPPQGRNDPIELLSLLTSSVDLATHHFRKANVKAELTCRMSRPLIYGEAAQLKQAFFNLLLNAAQLVGSGGRLEIVVDESTDSSGFLAIELWGTEGSGRGHDFSQTLRCLIDPGSQADVMRGLGLSLAKEVFDAAGARMEVGREGNCGVPLIMQLPLRV